MSRRRKDNTGGIVLVFALGAYLVYLIIKAIIDFIGEYYVPIIIFISIVIVLIIIYYVYEARKKKKRVLAYQETHYFKETSIPYDIVMKDKGLYFEMLVLNKLKEVFPDSLVITNLLIPRKGSVNEYSEIDLVFLHETGLYVLELKNYYGYVYGNIENETWVVGYKNEYNRNTREFFNPIRQNEKHIWDLNKYFNNTFVSYIIFSKNTEIDSNIDNVCYLDDFINKVKLNSIIYMHSDLEEIDHEIRRINVYEKLDKHIERIKFNEQRYSGYKRK